MYKEWNQAGGKLNKGGFDFLPSMFYFCDPYLGTCQFRRNTPCSDGLNPIVQPPIFEFEKVSLVFYNMYHQPLQFNRTAIWTEYTFADTDHQRHKTRGSSQAASNVGGFHSLGCPTTHLPIC